jgi:hypothetical protein
VPARVGRRQAVEQPALRVDLGHPALDPLQRRAQLAGLVLQPRPLAFEHGAFGGDGIGETSGRSHRRSFLHRGPDRPPRGPVQRLCVCGCSRCLRGAQPCA